MIDFIYELPGGMEIAVRADVSPESITIYQCASMTGDLDPEKIWIDTDDDVGLLPLTMLLKQEAAERMHVGD